MVHDNPFDSFADAFLTTVGTRLRTAVRGD